MKQFLTATLILAAFTFTASAQQVEINKPLLLNGATSADRRIQNLGPPLLSTDAVNAQVVQSGALNFAVASGPVNAFELSLTPAPTAYVTGMAVSFQTNQAVTGPATININGLGPRSLYKQATLPLAAADLGANQIVFAIYDGAAFQLSAASPVSVLSPASIGYDQYKYHVAPGNGSWTVPAGVTQLMVEVWGGGGGAGGSGCPCSPYTSTSHAGGGGGSGGAGGYGREILHVTPGTTYSITIGRGNGTSSCGVAGTDGGTTSFGNLVMATGGKGGRAGAAATVCSGASSATFPGGAGGAGGTSTATVHYTGEAGPAGTDARYDAMSGAVTIGRTFLGGLTFVDVVVAPAVPTYLQDYVVPFRTYHTIKPAPGAPLNPNITNNTNSGFLLISY